MRLTQEEIKELANLHSLTKDTKIYDGMHIYTILNGEKGLDLLFDEVILKPTDKDWEAFENSLDDNEKEISRRKAEREDANYWIVVESDCINENEYRNILSEDEIYKVELEHLFESSKIIVTWS